MRLLHTSDWHLGHRLYGRKRYEEFADFLQWLLKLLVREQIHGLVIAGDVFDTTTPSHRAQQLYYEFLHQAVSQSPCRHLVIVGGNHDSPSLLEAPKSLLQHRGIQVIGAAPKHSEEEVLVLRDAAQRPELIVCAVPYLRDQDLRIAVSGEDPADKTQQLLAGLGEHYAAVARAAERVRADLGGSLPILATGHLFAQGGQTVEGDGVRELYIGSLARFPAGDFPRNLDYIALGHLHRAQSLGDAPPIRYSGAPLPLSFGEARRAQSLYLVEFTPAERVPQIRQIPVPRFQRLEQLRGDWAQLEAQLRALREEGVSAWLEILYEGKALGNLRARLAEVVQDSELEILRITDARHRESVLRPTFSQETLADLHPEEVFERCLAQHEIPEEQRSALRLSYREVLHMLANADPREE